MSLNEGISSIIAERVATNRRKSSLVPVKPSILTNRIPLMSCPTIAASDPRLSIQWRT